MLLTRLLILAALALIPLGEVMAADADKDLDPMTPPMRDLLDRRLRSAAGLPIFARDPRFALKVESVVNKCAVWDAVPIKGCFMGDPSSDTERKLRAKLQAAAEKWAEGRAPLFDFGLGPTFRTCDPSTTFQVRVAFVTNEFDSWGCVGRNSLDESLECGRRRTPVSAVRGLATASVPMIMRIKIFPPDVRNLCTAKSAAIAEHSDPS